MTPPLSPDLLRLQKNIKEAYEEAVREKCDKVKDLLFDCIVLLSKATTTEIKSKKKKHKWTKDEELVGYYLARKYDDTSSFRKDIHTKELLKYRSTISMGSLQMLIQNFYHLMKKDKGLVSASKLAKDIHSYHKDLPMSKLQLLTDETLAKMKTK